VSVFEVEATRLIIAMEFAASKTWGHFWLESDSSSVV